jgi:hypothetical protein
MVLNDRQPTAARTMHKLAIALALLAVTVGCDTASGGGWIVGLHDDRATFGFSVRCRDTRLGATLSDGQIDWHDGFVSFHGVVEPESFLGMTCEEFAENSPTIIFTGTYTPHHSAGSGTFTATVFDGGEPGALVDTIDIELTGGDFNGYVNGGPVQEGNVQVS